MRLNKITKNDIKTLESYFEKNQPELSPYSLSSIFLWNGCIYDVYLGFIDENLIIAELPYENPNKKRILFPLSQNTPAPDKLSAILRKINFTTVYYAPESYIKQNPEIQIYFEIYEQTDYTDYVYRTESLKELVGSKYSSKRNLLHQFEKIYKDSYEVKPFSQQTIDSVISFIHEIKDQISPGKSFDIYNCEISAIENIKRYINDISFFGICVYIAGKISSFAIGSHLNNNTCILNFEKADKNVKGLYQFTDREFAKHVYGKYLFINKESDIGKEGLKKAKISYHPHKTIKSFMLVLKDNQ